MNLFPSPKDFGDFSRRFFDDNFGDRFSSMMNPIRTDIRETEDEYILDAELAGFDKEDIHLEYQENMLTISAKQEYSSEDKDTETDTYLRRERYSSSFRRQFIVPDVEEEKIQAAFENGLLTVRLPKHKSDKSNSRRITID